MNVYLPWTWLATQWPCDSWFHVPLQSELNNVFNAWTNLWAWGTSQNMESYLKLPPNWAIRLSDWQVINQWTQWYYWSSYADTSDVSYYILLRSNWNIQIWNNNRIVWIWIRPFKDVAVTPDNSWTVLYQWTWNAWIYHNSALGLISISSDGSTWITIADKNLWATTVWNSWDTVSASNCWWYFQRWNNYMFPFNWSITTSTTLVDASTYWPWNYYYSSTFVIRTSSPYWWDSSNNTNLRWWEDGNVKKKKIRFIILIK